MDCLIFSGYSVLWSRPDNLKPRVDNNPFDAEIVSLIPFNVSKTKRNPIYGALDSVLQIINILSLSKIPVCKLSRKSKYSESHVFPDLNSEPDIIKKHINPN